MRVPDYGRGDWEGEVRPQRGAAVDRTDRSRWRDDPHRPVAPGRQHQGDGTASHHPVADPERHRSKLYDEARRPVRTHHGLLPRRRVIYTNPFARYDASAAETPYAEPTHKVNVPLTILFNLTLLALCAGTILAFRKTVIKW